MRDSLEHKSTSAEKKLQFGSSFSSALLWPFLLCLMCANFILKMKLAGFRKWNCHISANFGRNCRYLFVSTSCLFYQRQILVNYVEKHRTSNFQVTARDQNMRSSEKPWNLVPGVQKIGFLDEDSTTRELRNHTAPNSLGLFRIVFFLQGGNLQAADSESTMQWRKQELTHLARSRIHEMREVFGKCKLANRC